MTKHYEQLIATTDPFCIMCGEGPEYDIPYWKAISLEELKMPHEGNLIADFWTDPEQYKAMFDEEWTPTPEDFDEWLEKEIQTGRVRKI